MGAKRTGAGNAGTSKGGLVKVGRIGKLFGTDGGLTLSLFDGFPDEIKNEEPLWVMIDSLAVPLFTEHFERKGRSGALVRFADMDTTQRAEELVGHEVYLPSAEDERGDGELYFEDLEGYAAVIREDGSTKELKGVISAYLDNEFNPLFEIESDDGEVLIPAVEDFVEVVDTEKREVVFMLPEGLLSLNG